MARDRDVLTCTSWFIGRARILHTLHHRTMSPSPSRRKSIAVTHQVNKSRPAHKRRPHSITPGDTVLKQLSPASRARRSLVCTFMPSIAGISHLTLPRALERVYLSPDLLWLLKMQMISPKLWTSLEFQSTITRPVRVWDGA